MRFENTVMDLIDSFLVLIFLGAMIVWDNHIMLD